MDLLARSEVEAQLRALGVQAGGVLMVHSSMRKVGPIEGRAAGVLEALTNVLDGGTLMMVLGADEDEPFDATETEVDTEEMGILPEIFRTSPGVAVSDHAAARFAARGRHAEELLRDPPLHDYFGPGSLLTRFEALDGQVLRLGADLDTVTLTHWAEYKANLPNKRRVRIRYVREDIGEQWIESLDDSNGIQEWSEGDYFPQILVDFFEAGHAAHGPVGRCTADLFRARAFVDYAVAWMEGHLV